MSIADKIARAKADLDAVYLAGKSSAGGGGSSAKGVNFYDYDGTLLHSYSVEEAQELTELPELPSHDGLACQGWNYTLDGIKEYGDRLDVGAMYITDDGKTRLYISIVSDGRMSLPLCFGQTVANGVTIEWGDGSTETFDGTGTLYVTHDYSAVGDYVISLAPQDGCTLTLGGGAANSRLMGGNGGTVLTIYTSMLKKAEIGDNVAFSNYAFNLCRGLASITIPASVTTIGSHTFNLCRGLASITIPASVTTIGTYAFCQCSSLNTITIPASVTSIGAYTFDQCSSLNTITIPASVTTIGTYAFSQCSSLTTIVIPSSVTSIGTYAFQYCERLHSVTILSKYCSLDNYAFAYCPFLVAFSTHENTTLRMYSYIFANCHSLCSFSLNGSFASDYFTGCVSLAYLDFTKCTSVPRLSKSTYVTNINDDCKIRVPAALYDEWIVATNWSAVADRIVAV